MVCGLIDFIVGNESITDTNIVHLRGGNFERHNRIKVRDKNLQDAGDVSYPT
jgi:hypothetical protein